MSGRADRRRWIERCSKRLERDTRRRKLLMTQPGVGPITALAFAVTIGEASPVSAGQAGGQLCGADSARAQLGRKAAAGCDQQARQPVSAHVAGGSGAERGALRSRVSQAVFASLPSEAERRGQGSGRAQVGGTTLLDAAHPDRYPEIVRIESSPRVPLVGCPLDRGLIGRSRLPWRRDVRIEESWSMSWPNRWLVER